MAGRTTPCKRKFRLGIATLVFYLIAFGVPKVASAQATNGEEVAVDVFLVADGEDIDDAFQEAVVSAGVEFVNLAGIDIDIDGDLLTLFPVVGMRNGQVP